MKKTCTCIIPFYNEGERIIGVLNKITKNQNFDKIILVNDGSIDSWEKIVKNYIKKNKLTHTSLISYKQNKWKSHAVYRGLQKVTSKYVFLFDADLTNIKNKEINFLINSIYKNPEIDMWILRRIYAKRYIKILYRELILSWQRMLTTIDLKKIFKNKFDKYQLEFAINTYMQKNKKTVIRYPFSADNTFKSQKLGLIKWLGKDLSMYKNIINYQWFSKSIKHMFLFKPIDIKKYIKHT